jgi:5-methylcytosine-specific restriction endonuclease McrA
VVSIKGRCRPCAIAHFKQYERERAPQHNAARRDRLQYGNGAAARLRTTLRPQTPCAGCGAIGFRLLADHIKPLWAGGLDVDENVWPLCDGCHDAKTAQEARLRATMKRTEGSGLYGPPRGLHGDGESS